MTPKEASIELELIRQQVQRLVRIVGITPADYDIIQDSCANITESAAALQAFVGHLRSRAKALHPPKVPAPPAQRIVDPIMSTGCLTPETMREIRDIMNGYNPLPKFEIIKERKSISGGVRPLGRLE